MARGAEPRTYFTSDEQDSIVQAIGAAEARGEGEIRVHLGSDAADAMKTARGVFETLGMERTSHRTGVLIYVALSRREVVVLGDEGIDAVTPDSFWEDLVRHVIDAFRQDDAASGLVRAIERVGDAFAASFPFESDRRPDRRLPDDLSYGEPTE